MDWTALARIGLLGAAPFTGGATLAALPLVGGGGGAAPAGGNQSGAARVLGGAGAVGSVLGAQQGGANNARVAQGELDNTRDRNAVDLFGTQQAAQDHAGQLDLQRKSAESANRSTTAKQAMIGALLGGGITPTSFNGGQASGGLLRSFNANPEALAAMKLLGSQGATAQSTPMQFQGGQVLQAPTLSAPQKIDTGNGGFMNTLSKLAQIAGAVSPFLHPRDTA